MAYTLKVRAQVCMDISKIVTLALLASYQSVFSIARADVIELTGALESARFVNGLNLTNNQFSGMISGEWSANNGTFSSLSCFFAEHSERRAAQRGCDASVGWFGVINEKNALTLALTQHDYSGPELIGWEYTDATLNWHIGKNNLVTFRITDSLFGRNFTALTTSFEHSKVLSDQLRVKFEVGFTSLQSAAPIDTLEYGVISAEYGDERWVAELKLIYSGSGYNRFVQFDTESTGIAVNFRYRLY